MIRATLALLVLLAATATTAAEVGKPKLLAFVVGIERYADPELDALRYAADDARAVYAQLGVVAELDPRSVLLVADDEASAEEEQTVTAQRLRDALEAFVPKIKDGVNVVVYLGGHGTLSPDERLRYLPSDYDPSVPRRFVPFDDILRSFREEIDGKGLRQTSVTFLVNMCGAGNAALAGPGRAMAAENPKLVEKARQMFLEGQFGFERYAILPATPKDRNAFERDDFKGSEFAHHLLVGLSGPAARVDGGMTTRALFDHLNQALGGELPWSDNYAGDIVLGRTGALEGEAHYLLGTGLLAAARAIGPGEGATLSRPELAERKAQADLLYDLALDQLGRVESRNPDLAPRARLRFEQTMLASGGTANPKRLVPLAESSRLDERERQEASELADPADDGPVFPTLKAFRDHLGAGARVYIALLEEASYPNRNRSWDNVAYGLTSVAEVKDFSQDFVGRPWMLEDVPGLAETVRRWRADADQQAGVTNHLMVIYSGRADVWRPAGVLRPLDPQANPCLRPDPDLDPLCRVAPVNQDLIGAVQELWRAPLTFVFDAPFGGILLDQPPNGTHPISLLLAARERNGMTYYGSSGSTSHLLAQAFIEGVEDPGKFDPLAEFQIRTSQGLPSAESSPYVAGTAAWIPSWGMPDARPVLAGQLAPLGRFALHVAAGCAERAFAECDGVLGVGPAADGRDVFDRLTEAAAHDLARHASQAANAYDAASSALRNTPIRAGELPGRPSGSDLVGEARSMLLQNVERRATGALSKVGRRVVLLPVGIEDYASPLVADLPHVNSDLAAYGSMLRRMLSGGPGGTPNTRVESAPSECGVLKGSALHFRTASEFIDCLRRAVSGLHEQDLLLLVFSGRGAEIEGRRYLAMSEAGAAPALGPTTPTSQTPLPDGQSSVRAKDVGLVDLEDVAAAVAGHWFLGIYDAQFSPPVLDPARGDQLLDKHVDSVRARPADTAPARIDEGMTITAASGAFPRPQSRGGLPPLQVHVWLEGRLTQHAATSLPCLTGQADAPAVASSFAAAVLRTMPAQTTGTYRDWLRAVQADPCLQRVGEWTSVVFQGDLDLPLLASGEGAEFVDYFYDGIARHDINLRVAKELAEDVSARFPAGRNRLTWAALLVTLAQLHGEDAELHGFLEDRAKWITEAISLLEAMKLEEFRQGAVSEPEQTALNLWAIRVELLSRSYALWNRSDDASLRVLRDAKPAAVLDQRGLSQRLVSLSGEFLRRDPGVILSFARAKLRELGEQGGAPAAAMAELEALIRVERARRREPFRIVGEGSGSAGGAW